MNMLSKISILQMLFDISAMVQCIQQNGTHFAKDIFKFIFQCEKLYILVHNSFEFVSKCLIGIMPPLVQIMAWCQTGDKPLYEPMMV